MQTAATWCTVGIRSRSKERGRSPPMMKGKPLISVQSAGGLEKKMFGGDGEGPSQCRRVEHVQQGFCGLGKNSFRRSCTWLDRVSSNTVTSCRSTSCSCYILQFYILRLL